MITDSPYDYRGLLLKPRIGITIGLLGAGLMLLVLALFEPLNGLSPSDMLSQITHVLLSKETAANCVSCDPWVGLIGHMFLGIIFGVLYALCLQTVPNRGIVGVSVFYGFVIWVIGSVLIGLLIDESVRAVLRSWPWLVAHLIYGIFLALVAIQVKRLKERGPGIVVPVD